MPRQWSVDLFVVNAFFIVMGMRVILNTANRVALPHSIFQWGSQKVARHETFQILQLRKWSIHGRMNRCARLDLPLMTLESSWALNMPSLQGNRGSSKGGFVEESSEGEPSRICSAFRSSAIDAKAFSLDVGPPSKLRPLFCCQLTLRCQSHSFNSIIESTRTHEPHASASCENL
jgi:hypothetical protein